MDPGQWAYYNVFNRPPGAPTVLPIGPSILAGLAVFAIVAGISVGFGFLSYSAGMGALVTLGLVALGFGYRCGLRAVLGAAFTALLPAALAVGGADDCIKARGVRAAAVTAADLAHAPEADVFVLRDFRVAAEAAHVYRTYRTVGGPPQPVYFGVAPLVPAAWRKGQPVPAWLACEGSDEGDCRNVLAFPLRAAARVDRLDYERYRSAVESAARADRLAHHRAARAPPRRAARRAQRRSAHRHDRDADPRLRRVARRISALARDQAGEGAAKRARLSRCL